LLVTLCCVSFAWGDLKGDAENAQEEAEEAQGEARSEQNNANGYLGDFEDAWDEALRRGALLDFSNSLARGPI